MKRPRARTLLLQVLLIGLLVGELSVVRDAVRWQRRPRPQTIDPQSLDRETAGDIRRLWRTAFDGGGGDDWQRLAECYAVYGRFPEALETCRQARLMLRAGDRLQPWRSSYWEGLILDRLGRPRQAIQAFVQSLEVAPLAQRPTLWHLVGRNRLRLEEVREAEVAFEQAGDLRVSRYERVRIMVRTGRGREAIPILDKLLSETPDCFQLHHWKARAAEAIGDREMAQTHDLLVQRTSRSLPTDLVVEHLLAEAQRFGFWGRLADARRMLERRDVGGAIVGLRRLVGEDAHPAATRLLASALFEAGQFAEAREMLGRLRGQAAMGPLDWLLTGDVLDGLGSEHREAAIEAWERSLRLRPTEAARTRLSRVRRRPGSL